MEGGWTPAFATSLLTTLLDTNGPERPPCFLKESSKATFVCVHCLPHAVPGKSNSVT